MLRLRDFDGKQLVLVGGPKIDEDVEPKDQVASNWRAQGRAG